MWYVFLWLNLCSSTVFCQRRLIPNHYYHMESPYYPRRTYLSTRNDQVFNKLTQNQEFIHQKTLLKPPNNLTIYDPLKYKNRTVQIRNTFGRNLIDNSRKPRKRYDYYQQPVKPYVVSKPEFYILSQTPRPPSFLQKLKSFPIKMFHSPSISLPAHNITTNTTEVVNVEVHNHTENTSNEIAHRPLIRGAFHPIPCFIQTCSEFDLCTTSTSSYKNINVILPYPIIINNVSFIGSKSTESDLSCSTPPTVTEPGPFNRPPGCTGPCGFPRPRGFLRTTKRSTLRPPAYPTHNSQAKNSVQCIKCSSNSNISKDLSPQTLNSCKLCSKDKVVLSPNHKKWIALVINKLADILASDHADSEPPKAIPADLLSIKKEDFDQKAHTKLAIVSNGQKLINNELDDHGIKIQSYKMKNDCTNKNNFLDIPENNRKSVTFTSTTAESEVFFEEYLDNLFGDIVNPVTYSQKPKSGSCNCANKLCSKSEMGGQKGCQCSKFFLNGVALERGHSERGESQSELKAKAAQKIKVNNLMKSGNSEFSLQSLLEEVNGRLRQSELSLSKNGLVNTSHKLNSFYVPLEPGKYHQLADIDSNMSKYLLPGKAIEPKNSYSRSKINYPELHEIDSHNDQTPKYRIYYQSDIEDNNGFFPNNGKITTEKHSILKFPRYKRRTKGWTQSSLNNRKRKREFVSILDFTTKSPILCSRKLYHPTQIFGRRVNKAVCRKGKIYKSHNVRKAPGRAWMDKLRLLPSHVKNKIHFKTKTNSSIINTGKYFVSCESVNSTTESITSAQNTTEPPSSVMNSVKYYVSYETGNSSTETEGTSTDVTTPTTTETRQTAPDLSPTHVESTRRLVPDTGNNQPTKLQCELTSGMDCICCPETAVADLNRLVGSLSDPERQSSAIAAYKCSDYRPLNASYRLSSDLKPRLISRKRKEMLPDEKTGPKEVMRETFHELLNRGIPNEGVDYYIFPSTSLKMPCFTGDGVVQLSPNTADFAKYEWTHGNNQSITEGRVVEDGTHKGLLEIRDAAATDADSYRCTVTYINPDTDETISSVFLHSLFVVELPKVVLHSGLHYTGDVRCDEETLEMFDLYLPQQVEELICGCGERVRRGQGERGQQQQAGAARLCQVELHNPLCRGDTFKAKRLDPKMIWNFEPRLLEYEDKANEVDQAAKMEMSLNYEVDMVDVSSIIDAAINKTHCNPFCQLKILLKLVDTVRESLAVALSHPVRSGTGVTFKPDITTMNIKMVIGCAGGLQLYQGFCIPCPRNTFSEEGSTECSRCPGGSYQPLPGSKKCKRCDSPFEPGCSQLFLSPVFIAWIIIGITGTLVFCCCCICLCKRRRRKKKTKKSFRTDSTRRNIFKKRKRKKEESSDEESEPPSPPSEDFSS